MYIGRRLAYLRRKRGFSQEGVAAGVVSRGHYSNIEAGRYRALNDILVSLADKLDVPANYLLQWESSSPVLEHYLIKLQYCLDNYEYKEAESFIQTITKEFTYINSLHQEIHFLLLESLFYIKIKDYHRAKGVIEKVQYLTDEGKMVPACLKYLFYYVTGAWFYVAGFYEKSLANFKTALEKASSKNSTARLYYNMALALYETYDRGKAAEYGKKALEIFINEHKWLHIIYIYLLLGVIHWDKREYSESEAYLHKALDLVKVYGNDELEGKVYHNLGLVYDSKHDKEKSIKYLILSVDKKLADNCESIIITYGVLAEVLISAGQITRAGEVVRAAREYAKSEEHFSMLMAIEAKIHYTRENWTKYEEIMERLITYYRESERWSDVKLLSEEYSEYLGNRYKYKDAFYYSRAALEAYRKLAEKGGA